MFANKGHKKRPSPFLQGAAVCNVESASLIGLDTSSTGIFIHGMPDEHPTKPEI